MHKAKCIALAASLKRPQYWTFRLSKLKIVSLAQSDGSMRHPEESTIQDDKYEMKKHVRWRDC